MTTKKNKMKRFVHSFVKFSFSAFFTAALFLSTEAFAQIKNNYAEARREIQKEVNLIQRYTPDDFPSIKNQIALSRKVVDSDLTNQNVPDEIEKKELLKYARAFRDYTNDISEIKKKYANEARYKPVKDILMKEYDLSIENANNVYKLINDGVKNGSTYAEINRNDKANEDYIAQKTIEMNANRDSFFAGFSSVENSYVELNNCISSIAKKENENYRSYPVRIFMKFKNDDACRKYKSVDSSAKIINEFLGKGKPLSLSASESENYRFDLELSCSFGSILGGIVIQKNNQVQVPECIQGLGQFADNYNKIVNYYAKQNEAENAKQQSIKNAEKQQVIQKARELASKDNVARALNYASGSPEDASGSNFFYPIDNSSGKCVYGVQFDNSAMGQMSQSAMDAFSKMAPILGAVGVQAPNTSTTLDLNKVDLSSIAFYKVNGATPKTKNTQSIPYLKYQSKVDGLPDYFECDSNTCSMERLQRAWKLVAQTCKGTKKAF